MWACCANQDEGPNGPVTVAVTPAFQAKAVEEPFQLKTNGDSPPEYKSEQQYKSETQYKSEQGTSRKNGSVHVVFRTSVSCVSISATEDTEGIPTAKIKFRVPDFEELREVTFTHRPLGVDFSRTAPLTVRRVKEDTEASAMGVQPGWVVAAVAGVEAGDLPFDQIYAEMRKVTAILPHFEEDESAKAVIP